MNNKKGLSQVVTVVIFVALALVLVGVIWTVVSNLVNKNVGQTLTAQKCLDVEVKPIMANCNSNGICNVTVERSATGEEIAGIKINFIDKNGENNKIYEASETEGNIEKLGRKTFKNINTGLTSVGKIEVISYFKDDQGEDILCSSRPSIAP